MLFCIIYQRFFPFTFLLITLYEQQDLQNMKNNNKEKTPAHLELTLTKKLHCLNFGSTFLNVHNIYCVDCAFNGKPFPRQPYEDICVCIVGEIIC